ncbi:formate dehydrogenase accessory protein FdhE [Chloroflexota bacterium]
MAEDKSTQFVKILEEEGNRRGLPLRFLDFYKIINNVQSETEQNIDKTKLGLSIETINERLERNRPLIGFDELATDWPLVNDAYAKVIAVFSDYADILGELPEKLKRPGTRPSLAKNVARAWLKGAKLPASIKINNADEYILLEAVIHATLKPFLVSNARVLIGPVNQERWRRDYCPVCHGKPDLAFLDSERGARWLVCSRCDTKWLFQRLQCPYCGNQEQDGLAYFTDDKGVYRLYVCEKCQKYIKAVDLRNAGQDVILPLERLLTLDMDRQAQEKGYKPGHSEDLIQSTD